MELTKEQKEALKWVYQFVHDLADPESPTYEDLACICEGAEEMKVHMEVNFATDILEGSEDESLDYTVYDGDKTYGVLDYQEKI